MSVYSRENGEEWRPELNDRKKLRVCKTHQNTGALTWLDSPSRRCAFVGSSVAAVEPVPAS